MFRAFAPGAGDAASTAAASAAGWRPCSGDRRHIELAYSLQFTMPGTPVLRYGEEIGMGEDLALDGRDAIRTPMQWDDSPSGGFSTASEVRPRSADAGPWPVRQRAG